MVVKQEHCICSGCKKVINDKYIFQVDNQKLHYNCLKCSKCSKLLNGKCWFKQNKFYCREDYDRLIQSMTSCLVCKRPIEKNTLKHTIYNTQDASSVCSSNVHLECFQCYECGRVLNSGDHFVLIKDDKFACSFHYSTLRKYLSTNATAQNHHLTHHNNHLNDQLNNHLNNDLQPPINTNKLISQDQPSIYSSIDQPASHHSLNSIDYSNFSGNETSDELQSTNDDFKLYYDSYNSPQPASDQSIDCYWTQVSCNSSSPFNSNENLNTLQRFKGRPKKRKIHHQDPGRLIFL